MIIEELDREGINLQETKLNLINQGFKRIWNLWIELMWEQTIRGMEIEITMQSLKKSKLI